MTSSSSSSSSGGDGLRKYGAIDSSDSLLPVTDLDDEESILTKEQVVGEENEEIDHVQQCLTHLKDPKIIFGAICVKLCIVAMAFIIFAPQTLLVNYVGFGGVIDNNMATKLYIFSWENSATTDVASLLVTASNEYGAFRRDAYPWLDNPIVGSQLVEPYRVTTLTVARSSTTDSSTDTSKNTFLWTIEGDGEVEVLSSDDPTLAVMKGISITVKFRTTGVYALVVTEYDTTGAVVTSTHINAICKYVKRELRTLTVADREAFLNAAATIWKYTTEEGQALYGEKFTGMEKFTALHIIQSNDIRCDSYHEGSGFITHHLAMSISFDAALRAVDPSVTLPYWDFTIEGQAIASTKKTPSYMLSEGVSPVFTDTWFGAVDANNHIADSRWKGIKIPLAAADTPRHLKNSFGQWRSYWNNNPDPYVTRHMFEMCGLEPSHKKVPSCSSHYSVLNTTTLGDLQMVIPSDGHGPVHIQIGGLYGSCADGYQAFITKWASVLDEDMTAEQVAAYGFDSANWGYGLKAPRRGMFEKSIMGEYFHIFRAFWRSHMCAIDGTPGLLECPDTCDASAIASALGLEVGGSGSSTADMTGVGDSGVMGQDEYTPAAATRIISECPCQVNKLINGSTTWSNVYPCVVATTKQPVFDAVMPPELLEDMVNMIARNPLLHGDMIESSSPADIIFWLVHPALDRMLAAKRLPNVKIMGDTPFVKWPLSDGSEEEWLEWSPYTVEAGENIYFPEAYTCVGHGKHDGVLSVKLPFTTSVLTTALSIDSSSAGNGDGEISNWEFFLAIDPNNVHGSDMVYDHFDWDHCKAESIEQQYVGITTKVVHSTNSPPATSENTNTNGAAAASNTAAKVVNTVSSSTSSAATSTHSNNPTTDSHNTNIVVDASSSSSSSSLSSSIGTEPASNNNPVS